jgi:hypothetical protein
MVLFLINLHAPKPGKSKIGDFFNPFVKLINIKNIK